MTDTIDHSARIRLIVGLGNIGPEYEDTRHNAGYWFADAVANDLGARFFLAQQLAKIGRCEEATALQQKLMARAVEERNQELQRKLKAHLCAP